MEMSKLIFGVLIVTLIVGIFSLFIGEVGTQSTVTYGNLSENTLNSFDKLDEITQISDNVSANFNTSEEANVFDLLGFYFKKGYLGMKTIGASTDVVTSLNEEASVKLGLPGIIKTVLGALIGLIFLFTLISLVLKWRV